jgi:hypothetical protein
MTIGELIMGQAEIFFHTRILAFPMFLILSSVSVFIYVSRSFHTPAIQEREEVQNRDNGNEMQI